MLTFFRNLLHALLYDEARARNIFLGLIGVLATSGAAYADQVASLFPYFPKAALSIRALSVLAAFSVAAHNAPAKIGMAP